MVQVAIKSLFLFSTFLFSFPFLINLAYAHCPLCTAATGAAVAAARWYGVNDLIVGTFIGGFVVSTGFWFHRILMKRNKYKTYIPFQLSIITLVSVILTIVTFYMAGLLGNLDLKFVIFGIDRLLVGTVVGSTVTISAFYFHEVLRKMNNNKTYFPFQVIAISIVFLVLTSFSFYIVGWV